MNKKHLQHAIIAVGILSAGFLFWYLLPRGEKEYSVVELRDMLQFGETPQERARGAAGLGARGDTPSVSLLLVAMEDESALVRQRAGIAIMKILGADFFFDAEAPAERRSEVIGKYRALWTTWKEKTNFTGELTPNSPSP